MCSTIEAHAGADFYAALARFAADFFAIEGQAFDLLDS
jgi:TorA maturation chaperone TorD